MSLRGAGVSEGVRASQRGLGVLHKILQHCCCKFFFQVSGRGSGVKGGHWIMVYEYGYEYGFEKERNRELNQRQKVRFSTLLMPLCSMAAAPLVTEVSQCIS